VGERVCVIVFYFRARKPPGYALAERLTCFKNIEYNKIVHLKFIPYEIADTLQHMESTKSQNKIMDRKRGRFLCPCPISYGIY